MKANDNEIDTEIKRLVKISRSFYCTIPTAAFELLDWKPEAYYIRRFKIVDKNGEKELRITLTPSKEV